MHLIIMVVVAVWGGGGRAVALPLHVDLNRMLV